MASLNDPNGMFFKKWSPYTARSMMAGWVFLILTGACQFGHDVGGFTTNFIHSCFSKMTKMTKKARLHKIAIYGAI